MRAGLVDHIDGKGMPADVFQGERTGFFPRRAEKARPAPVQLCHLPERLPAHFQTGLRSFFPQKQRKVKKPLQNRKIQGSRAK